MPGLLERVPWATQCFPKGPIDLAVGLVTGFVAVWLWEACQKFPLHGRGYPKGPIDLIVGLVTGFVAVWL